jgi:hypothetical protein
VEKNGQIVSRFLYSLACASADILAPDVSDMQMSIVMLWQPSDALHDAFVDWLKNEFMPGVLDSPDALQSSIYKLQHASVAQTTGVDIQDISKMKTYMTIWEFGCEDLPWQVLISLSGQP